MNERIEKLNKILDPYRNKIISHPLYSNIETIENLHRLMEHHVYAVWDFMSLLKALQSRLTSVEYPWFPQGNPLNRRLINEIVLEEESDVDGNNKPSSHFEIYLEAMEEAGAETKEIVSFLEYIKKERKLPNLSEPISHFLKHTERLIKGGKLHEIASSFTFGREELIPKMFSPIVLNLQTKSPYKLTKFIYYLDRHIELDGDHHSSMAIDLVCQLCGDDASKWKEVEEVAVEALTYRWDLWEAIFKQFKVKKEFVST